MSACASTPAPKPDLATLTKQVSDVERGFARTMADRDYLAFQRFLADEAIFFGPGNTPLRGREAVAGFWKKFYEEPEAPFSWEPELVQVLDSGTLALSNGPVRDPSGKHFANFQTPGDSSRQASGRLFSTRASACAIAPSERARWTCTRE